MQTFLPYPSFAESVRCLDRQRLGKQRVETLQIMGALLNNKGWVNHPATKMWRGYEWALLQYQEATVEEWMRRGYADTCYFKTLDLIQNNFLAAEATHDMPPWLGDEAFHISHQSNLLRKDPEHYGPLFPGVPHDLPYIWPPGPSTRSDKMLSQAPGNDNIMIQGAEVRFRNFKGEEKTFNSAGDRNFCIFLTPEDAAYMRERGWNIKQTKPREEGDEPQEYVQVAVSYGKGRPPRCVVVNSKGRLDIGADDVHMLDWADVKNWDVVLNPYPWDVNGKQGIKAYLKTLFATINEDELELLYADVPDAQDPTKGLSSTASEDDD